MTLGTKTLLFGVHQFILHPLFVLYAWIKLYKSFPNWKELICIFIHDWGYWGKPSLKCADGDKHPELGARLALYYLGPEYCDFILGHSSFYVKRQGIPVSKLMAPDKYWHCLVPLWFYKMLAVPTGEFAHYRGLQHARQVSKDLNEPDFLWWARLQIVCWEKVQGCYKIDSERLDK
jgi:hypothetical protein